LLVLLVVDLETIRSEKNVDWIARLSAASAQWKRTNLFPDQNFRSAIKIHQGCQQQHNFEERNLVCAQFPDQLLSEQYFAKSISRRRQLPQRC